MKKTIFAIFAVCALTILVNCFTGCGNWQVEVEPENQPVEQPVEQQEQPAPKASGPFDFWARYQAIPADADTVPCYIRNNLEEEGAYGLSDKLQMLKDGEWVDLPVLEGYLIPEIGVGIPAGATNEYGVPIKGHYPQPLEPGSYRAVKCILGDPSRNDLYAEFCVIEEN